MTKSSCRWELYLVRTVFQWRFGFISRQCATYDIGEDKLVCRTRKSILIAVNWLKSWCHFNLRLEFFYCLNVLSIWPQVSFFSSIMQLLRKLQMTINQNCMLLAHTRSSSCSKNPDFPKQNMKNLAISYHLCYLFNLLSGPWYSSLSCSNMYNTRCL